MNLRTALASLVLVVATLPARPQQPPTQPVIEVGALNAPTHFLTPDNQWSNLIRVHSTPDLDLYIEDPSTDTWLSRNAENFVDRGQFTLHVISNYKSRHACRDDQIRNGFSSGPDIEACNNYRYRIRQIAVDASQNTATLLSSAMVFNGGAIDPSTVRRDTRTQGFHALDADSQRALSNATRLVGQESHRYVERLRHPR